MHRVLLVEDEILVRLGLKNSIDWNRHNMQVIADVANGAEAWEVYEKTQPEVVITDLKMPVMGGIELIAKIRSVNPNTQLIILTCLEEFDLARKAMSLGVSDYIVKHSVSTEELEAVLAKLRKELARTSAETSAKTSMSEADIGIITEAPGGGMHPSSYEILHIADGKIKFKWRGNVCEAEAPAVFILPDSTPHELESLVVEAKFRFLELVELEEFPFTKQQVDDWNFMQARKDIYSKTVLASSLLQSLDFVYHLQSSGLAEQDSNLEEVCLLEIRKSYKLIAHILRHEGRGNKAFDRKVKHKSHAAVDLLTNYLDSRYKESFKLETLAEIVALDPSYLVRLFKKHMKMTPFEYLRDLRLRAAASYLSGSDMPISSILQETGFNSVHHFTRLFKSHYGQSPAEWRKRLKARELMA